MKEDTSENVEFAIKLQGDVLVPVDSHFPVEKFKAITDGHDADDKKRQLLMLEQNWLPPLKLKLKVLMKNILFHQNYRFCNCLCSNRKFIQRIN